MAHKKLTEDYNIVMEQKPKHLPSFQIAATYIGVIIGAGFASGQEVIQYFGIFWPIQHSGTITGHAAFCIFWLVAFMVLVPVYLQRAAGILSLGLWLLP